MRISQAVLFAAICGSPFAVFAAQAPVHAVHAQPPEPEPLAPSRILKPSLDNLQQTLFALRLEKWKRGTVREEADANVTSILRDLQQTLPPLLQQADASPESLSKVLPASRNIDALYDAFLRVEEASRVAAPGEQVTQLQQALYRLENARHALDESLQQTALAQEKQISELRSTVQAQAAIKCPVVPVVTPTCVAPAPHHKARRRHKAPAKKPPASTSPAVKNSTKTTGK